MISQATEPQVALATKRLRVEVKVDFTFHDYEETQPDGSEEMRQGYSDTYTGVAIVEVPADYTGPKPITKQVFGAVRTYEPDLAAVIEAKLGWLYGNWTPELLQEPVKVISINSKDGDLRPSDDEMSHWEMSLVSVEEEQG